MQTSRGLVLSGDFSRIHAVHRADTGSPVCVLRRGSGREPSTENADVPQPAFDSAVLDAVMHSAIAVWYGEATDRDALVLPTAVASVYLSSRLNDAAVVVPTLRGPLLVDVAAYAADGEPVALVRGLRGRAVPGATFAQTVADAAFRRLVYTPASKPLAAQRPSAQLALIGGNDGPLHAALAAEARVVPVDDAELVVLLDCMPLSGADGARAATELVLAQVRHLLSQRPGCTLVVPASDHVVNGALAGVATTAAAELGVRDIRVVHVAATTNTTAAVLARAALGASRAVSGSITLDDSGLTTAAWARVSSTSAAGFRVLPGEWVIVTGASGFIARQICTWLLGRGATRFVLISRTRPADFLPGSVSVAHLSASVADRHAVQAAIAHADQSGGIAAIVHAAGIVADGSMAGGDIGGDAIASVFEAKVDGTRVLLSAAQSCARAPRLVLCLSSVATVTGSAGQAVYTAACSAMDAMIASARADGLPALSVAFGPWADGGMAAGLGASLRAAGFLPMDTQTALGGLESALLRRATGDRVLVADMDWTRLASSRAASGAAVPSGCEALIPVAPDDAAERVPSSDMTALEKLVADADTEADRIAHVRAVVFEVIARVLALDGPLDASESLAEVGMDSLAAVELRNVLATETGLSLPATVLFDHSRPESLVAFLAEAMHTRGAARKAVPAPAPAATRPAPVDDDGDDYVAIIGIGCRFPGADDVDAFWASLAAGTDSVKRVDASRWREADHVAPFPGAPGKTYTSMGGYVDNMGEFDARLFGISPREAADVDPQQRLLLESTWTALEDAGYGTREARAGASVGVYVGLMNFDYALLQHDGGSSAVTPRMTKFFGTGTAASVAAGRLAYTFGLDGPTMTVDTACSASLVSVHLACRALLGGECDMAVAGGSNMIWTPHQFVNLSQMQMLSPDGHCKAFDASANGYVRGEGAGVVTLKRLSAARRDGDTVLAVIRGSAVNQDGRSSSLTAPHGPSQAAVIRTALARGHVAVADVGYVEAHGTGTALGDPIEVETLRSVYMSDDRDAPLVIGSVKSNIGHLESAAGVAGLIKTVLMLRKATVVPTLHVAQLNDKLPDCVRLDDAPADGRAIVVPRRRMPLTSRLAGVSAFGFSGTNAHLVVEAGDAGKDHGTTGGAMPLVLSNASEAGLRKQIERLLAHLESRTVPVDNLCYTLAVGRAAHQYRFAAVVSSESDLRQALLGARSNIAARPTGSVQTLLVLDAGALELDALLSGVPVFVEASAAALAAAGPAADARVFAACHALAVVLGALGISVAAVTGHAAGEYAAMVAAGILSLADAGRLLHERDFAATFKPVRPGMVFVASRTTAVLRGGDATARHLGGGGYFDQQEYDVRRDTGLDFVHIVAGSAAGPDGWLCLSPDNGGIVRVLARLFSLGLDIHWRLWFDQWPQLGRVPGVPTYVFNRKHFWIRDAAPAAPVSATPAAPVSAATSSDRLAAVGPDADSTQAYLGDHVVGGEYVLPGAAILGLLLAHAAPAALANVQLSRPVKSRAARLAVARGRNGQQLVVTDEENSSRHATADAADAMLARTMAQPDTRSATSEQASDALYRQLASSGLTYGPAFRLARDIFVGDGCARGCVSVPGAPSLDVWKTVFASSAVLDAAFHVLAAGLMRETGGATDPFVPVTIGGVELASGALPSETATVDCAWEYRIEYEAASGGSAAPSAALSTEARQAILDAVCEASGLPLTDAGRKRAESRSAHALGIDSLMAESIVNRVVAVVGASSRVAADVMFDTETIGSFIDGLGSGATSNVAPAVRIAKRIVANGVLSSRDSGADLLFIRDLACVRVAGGFAKPAERTDGTQFTTRGLAPLETTFERATDVSDIVLVTAERGAEVSTALEDALKASWPGVHVHVLRRDRADLVVAAVAEMRRPVVVLCWQQDIYSAGAAALDGDDDEALETTMITIDIENVRNPLSPIPSGNFFLVRTERVDGAAIDELGNVIPPLVLPAELPFADVLLSNARAGDVTTVNIQFTLANNLPADGGIRLDMPVGFTIDAANAAVTSPFGVDGLFTVDNTVDGDNVFVIRRAGLGGVVFAGVTVTDLRVTLVTTAGVTGPTFFNVTTLTDEDTPIDQLLNLPGPVLTAGPLRDLTATLDVDEAGAQSSLSLSFRLANAWPEDGVLTIDFPVGFGFNEGGATTVTSSDIPGLESTVTFSGSTMTLTRDGNEDTLPTDSVISLLLVSNLRNPYVAGPVSYTVTTLDAVLNDIDTETVAGNPIVPAPFVGSAVFFEDEHTGAIGSLVVHWESTNPLPVDGRIELTFPAGFAVNAGGATAASSVTAQISGGFTVDDSAFPIVGIVRDGAEHPADSPVTDLTLTNVKTREFDGPTTFSLATKTAGGDFIDATADFAGEAIVASTLIDVSITPLVREVGGVGNLEIDFATSNALPVDAVIALDYPPELVFSGSSVVTASAPAALDGEAFTVSTDTVANRLTILLRARLALK